MNTILIVALAGALGAVSRYGVVSLIGVKSFPWGTLTVNVIGSLLMGMAYVFIVDKLVLPAEYKPFIMTGFLGAFTTFSTFSLDTWLLIEKGEIISALLYIFASVVLCIVALAIGIYMSKSFI